MSDPKKRFEGTFVLAPSGSGKTTTLLYLITSDLRYVAKGKASVIVMDNNGDFLKNLVPLRFPEERIVIIEPDVEHPIAINPFALARKRLQTMTPNERETFGNFAISIIAHIFSTVGAEAKFTARQGTLFRHTVRLCLAVPNGDLLTMRDIFTAKSVEPYMQQVDGLSENARNFFREEFKTKNYQDACGELQWRLAGVLENETLTRMLNAPHSLDLTKELDDGKLIIVNTNRGMMGDRHAVIGRVMIALVRLAMRERDPTPEQQRMPTYFFIDECADYLVNDTQVADMIDDVRKYRLALTFATQRLAKIDDPNLKDALLSCGIVIARPNAADTQQVGRYINVKAEHFTTLLDRQFVVYERGHAASRITTIPHFSMAKFPHLSREETKLRRDRIRARYAWQKLPDVTFAHLQQSDDDDEIRPSSDW